jgi:hypothetical protein
MTGPEHYREAERLLGMAHRFTYGDGADATVGAALAAEAQAHATLALAAATAGQLADRYVGDGNHIDYWRTALGDRRMPTTLNEVEA